MNVARTGLFIVGSSKTAWGGLPDLKGVPGDVKKIWDVFVESPSGRGVAARAPLSQKLLDEGSKVVKQQFRAFVEALGADALAIFYFVGHGEVAGGYDLRLLLADSSKERQDETTLSAFDVIRTFEETGVAEWAVILDCCRAGVVLRDRAVDGARKKTNRGSLIVCATGMGNAWETPQHGGLLTHYLTEAIRTGSCVPPEDSFVDLPRAAMRACHQIKESHSGLDAIPNIEHSGSAAFRVATTPPISPPKYSDQVESVFFIGAKPDNATDLDEHMLTGACHILGRILAENGFRLIICNPWNKSADYHVALGYSGYREARSIDLFMPEGKETISNFERFKQALDNQTVAIEKYWYPVIGGGEFTAETWLYCQLQALDKANAVVALGGAIGRSASLLLRLAEARGVPVIPFTFLHGEAEAVYQRRKDFYAQMGVDKYLIHRNGVESLRDIISAVTLSRLDPSVEVGRVFISRAKEDFILANSFADQLQIRGITPVFGDEPKEHNRDPRAVIHERMRGANVCAIFWSAHFAVSPHCYDELTLALKRHREENLRLWLFRLDSTPVVHPDARALDDWYTPTTKSLEIWSQTVLGHMPTLASNT